MEILEKELETFESHKAELMSKATGQYALIKGQTVEGIFETQIDAIREGYKRWGNVPFLVKKVLEIEAPENFTSCLLGV